MPEGHTVHALAERLQATLGGARVPDVLLKALWDDLVPRRRAEPVLVPRLPDHARAPGVTEGRSRGRAAAVLLLSLVLVAAVAISGALINAGAVDGWYADADKPPGTPPGSVFGPVWTALYTAMAVAAWLVWRAAGVRGDAGGLPAALAPGRRPARAVPHVGACTRRTSTRASRC